MTIPSYYDGHGTRVHFVKSRPHLFGAFIDGDKTHDLRKKDRDYKVGDILQLEEYEPKNEHYTGRTAHGRITYITDVHTQCAASPDALHPDYCILSIRKMENVMSKPGDFIPGPFRNCGSSLGLEYPFIFGPDHNGWNYKIWHRETGKVEMIITASNEWEAKSLALVACERLNEPFGYDRANFNPSDYDSVP